MEISKILLSNYLPYAKSVIVYRAIPSIDGLKPVQRRVLYSMNSLHLGDANANTTKSVKIIGEVMGKYHPHGDSSIYEALVLMSTGYEGFNTPYIHSKGSFGKKYSRDLQHAASRYTEAKLTPICAEFFDGIKENAVDIIDNFDGTEKEPTLLPVRFPSILVNASSGVAVGTSSNIPSFSLKNACLAAQGMLKGTITDAETLAPVLGAPEFTTGGFLHCDNDSLVKLCKTGRGSFTISGHVDVYSNQIVIDEIPYTTTAEDIMDSIDEHMKDGTLLGVKNVRDEIGLEGLRLVVEIKSGYNSREVLRELCRLTPLRSKVSFRTRVIVEDRCKELNLVEVLEYWIAFRQQCIKRVYSYRLNKDKEKEHLLSTWDHIKNDIQGVVQMISSNIEAVAKSNLISNYGLDETQAEYLLEMRIRSITKDRAEKALRELSETRDRIKYSNLVISDEAERKNIIYKELDEIIGKYGSDNKTAIAPELTEEDNKAPEIKVSDEMATVVLTNNGFIKRLTNTNDIADKFTTTSGDYEIRRWNIRNNEYILVFDRYGSVHKILVDSIDSSRGKLTDLLYKKAGLEKEEDLIWVDACGDYSGYFNLIYPNGKGTRVYYSKASGNRSVYKAGYDEVKPEQYFLTQENQFFLITKRMKASYCDITRLGVISNRSAFKVARLYNGDRFVKIAYYKDVPNPEFINLDKYNKDYTVSIGEDILWVDDESIEEARKLMEEMKDKLNSASNNEEETKDKLNSASNNEEEMKDKLNSASNN